MEAYYNNLNSTINYHYTITLMPIGIVLNLFAIYIFQRPRLNKTTMGFLYTCQALADMFLLIQTIFVARGEMVFKMKIYNRSEFLCSISNFLRRFALHMCAFIYVFITVDRFLCVHYPNRFKFLKKRSYLSLIILIIAIFLVFYDSINLVYYLKYTTVTSVVNNKTVNSTVVSCITSYEVTIAADIMGPAMRVYVPTFIMMILNGKLVHFLFLSKKRVKANDQKKEIQFAFTVMLMNLMFLFFNLPVSVGFVLYDYNLLTHNPNKDYMAYLSFMLSMTQNVNYCYSVLTFFFNLFFNKIFRQEIVSLIPSRMKESAGIIKILTNKSSSNK
jgi:hypothetical protein